MADYSDFITGHKNQFLIYMAEYERLRTHAFEVSQGLGYIAIILKINLIFAEIVQ
ncbi:MAG: hypothetical protein HWD59_09370 [Coxiellaceae bacterium]|nr:MAG: hypothetical protein HWD59_09370 [Coxiellaceae bacterium]